MTKRDSMPHTRGGSRNPSLRASRLWVISALVAVVVATIDQTSKLVALHTLDEADRIPIIGDAFGLQLAFNAGAVLSLGSGFTWLFTALGLVAMVVLATASARASTAGIAVGIGVLWGGAAGNLWDRLFAPPGFGVGYVTDFLAYGTFFIGNFADVAIGVGVGVIVLGMLHGTREARALGDSDARS